MADRIQLTEPYAAMTLDGQPQIVLSGSIVDVIDGKLYPTATLVTKGVSTVIPKNSHAVSASGVRVR